MISLSLFFSFLFFSPPSCKVLDLSDNDLIGGLPQDLTFEAWPKLTHLLLSDNPHLGGSLAACIPQTCKRLQVIRLHNCALHGPLPEGLLANLPELKAVLVHDNALAGSSPLTLFEGEMLNKDRMAAAALGGAPGSGSSGASAGTSGGGGKPGGGEQDMKASKDHRWSFLFVFYPFWFWSWSSFFVPALLLSVSPFKNKSKTS